MGNILSSISMFIARRTDAALTASVAQSITAVNGASPSSAPQTAPCPPPTDEANTIEAPYQPSARSHPGSAENFDPSHSDSAQSASDRLLPLVAYSIRHEEPPRPKARPTRALNLLRASTGVAMTSHAVPTTHPPSAARQHESRPARLVLTETERVRLQIMQVQIRLASLSLYEGPIDGVLNPETALGVRHFQTLKGMRATGTLTAGTLNALSVPAIA